MLSVPIYDNSQKENEDRGTLRGVVQLVNKKDGRITTQEI